MKLSTLTVIVTLAATFKFIVEGVVLTYNGNSINLGHVDAMVYAALLTPVLGTHGYVTAKGTKETEK